MKKVLLTVLAASVPALALADVPIFDYEIARAKRLMVALEGTGQSFTFRDEVVRRRTGVSGSTVDTFCGTAASRAGNQGKVYEHHFYWILRVAPAQGHLSDYERGQWGLTVSAADESHVEFRKLCEGGSMAMQDRELLISPRSEVFSSGSTYDPFIDPSDTPHREWIIGTWSAGCYEGAEAMRFYSNGNFEGWADPSGRGTWSLKDAEITTKMTIKFEPMPDTDGAKEVVLPAPVVKKYAIQRLGVDRIRYAGHVYERDYLCSS